MTTFTILDSNNFNDRIVARTHNSGFAKVAVQRSADSFVVNQTLVLRINPDSYRDGKIRHLRQAANRQTV